MWILFLLCFTCSVIAQDTLYTHRILLTFNEPMLRLELFNVNNYTVFDDSLNEVDIHAVGVVEGDTAVVIYAEFLTYKTDYAIRVFNVTDTSNNVVNSEKNTAWIYFDGFDFNEQKPYIIIK